MTGRVIRRGIVATVAACLLVPAAPASADHHEMVIQEVFPGSTANMNQDYVTLQMYTGGQNIVGGHTLTVYAPNGTVADTATFPPSPGGDVDNGQSQATILLGAASQVVGQTPDLVDTGLTAIDPLGGAVCWNTNPVSFTDCVSWGNFTPPTMPPLPSATGGNVNSPGGFPDGQAITRKTGVAGCESFLEAADDRDDPDDWSGGGPVPRNNATAPTEIPCFNTEITKGPSGRTTDRTPTFKFRSVPPGAPNFACGIDEPDFNTCESPFTLPRQSRGRHTLFVRAINSVNAPDPTPAEREFKVIRRRR
jgi:hypothetical protein